MENYALVMAGGGGTRFWPLSRQATPKQLLNLDGDDVMINECVRRFHGLIPCENTYIVTSRAQREPLSKVLTPEVPLANILVEPRQRNTAACVLYASLHIMRQFGDCVLCVFPSDHYIADEAGFRGVLEKAIAAAREQEKIVTIGISPTFPSTGYGYIRKTGEQGDFSAYQVERFEEKPSLEKAQLFSGSPDYFWNSGMFVFRITVMLAAFRQHLPSMYETMLPLRNCRDDREEAEKLARMYQEIEAVSIDCGVMERADNVIVIPGNFGWSDMGSWDALESILPADENLNLIKAEHVCVDTKDCIIYGGDKLIATVGLNNIVIVDTGNALLVCDKGKTQDVKQVVEKLKEMGLYDRL